MNFDQYLDYRYKNPAAVEHITVQRIIEMASDSDAEVVNCCGESVEVIKVKDGKLAYSFPATGINVSNVEQVMSDIRRYSLLLLVPEFMKKRIGDRYGVCYIPTKGSHCLPITTSWINKHIRAIRGY